MVNEHNILNKPDHEVLQIIMLVELEAYRSGRSHFSGLVNALDVCIGVLVRCDSALVE